LSIMFDLSITYRDEHFYRLKNLRYHHWSNIDLQYAMMWPGYSRSIMEADERNYPCIHTRKLHGRRAKRLRKLARETLQNV